MRSSKPASGGWRSAAARGLRSAPQSLISAWLLALAIVSCGQKTPPSLAPASPRTAAAAPVAAAPAPATPASPAAATPAAATPAEAHQPTAVDQLRSELDKLFASPTFDRMLWGVQIQSLATGEILYRLNATKLVMPASNMKIVTLAAAAARLGWDYTFETKLLAAGPIERGALKGDLVIVGSGDPTINGRAGSPTAVFEDWAARLRVAGITSIEGQVVADDRAFDAESLGAGWSWDYLVYDYAAPVSALQYNEKVAQVVVRAGPDAGRPAVVSVRPEGTGLEIDNHVTTAEAGGPPAIDVRRLAGSDHLDVDGVVPLGSAEAVRLVAVDNTARFFARAFRAVLLKSGILRLWRRVA